MMRDFAFGLATPTDDQDIQRLLRENPVPGRVAISYERAPSYFHGCGVMGEFHQTVIARHLPSGMLAGLGCRTVRRLFINGREEQVGYLGQLRVDRRFRARWLVSAGFRLFRELDRDQRTNGYITTIIDGNRVAQGILVDRARPHFPRYREIDRLHTLALAARPLKPAGRGPEVRRACGADLEAIVAFLRQHGKEKQFFPALRAEDFTSGSPLTRGFRISDFFMATRGGALCGVVGLWDQSAFKQPVVRGYSGLLRWGRPLYNGYLRCRGEKPLPPPGAPIPLAYAAFTCIADNDPAVFDPLLRHLCTAAAERGHGRLMVGLTERDPLLPVARRYPHLPYGSRLYTACWKEESHFHERLDRRVSHLEIAAI